MDTDQLLDRVVQGESSAAAALLSRHEQRLRRMVSLRIDPRLAARVDPSDVVQDTLAEAHRRLIDYAADRRIPFYPWLRGTQPATCRAHSPAHRRKAGTTRLLAVVVPDSVIRIGGPVNDSGHSVAVDTSGNYYLTGGFRGTVDFDLGAGVTDGTSTKIKRRTEDTSQRVFDAVVETIDTALEEIDLSACPKIVAEIAYAF
jgi:hypothetical protein